MVDGTIIRFLKFFLRNLFVFLGLFWTSIEFTTAFFDYWLLEDWRLFIGVLLFSTLAALYFSLPVKSIEIAIMGTDSKIEIRFGDLFESTSHKAIPANEFFDSELGDLVSTASLHGKFITRYFGGSASEFDNFISRSLLDSASRVVRRPKGKRRRYKLGTTAAYSAGNYKVFLFALSRTDLKTAKASAEIDDLWRALIGLWEHVRLEAENRPVSIPLIGGGLSGVGLPTNDLLNLLVLSIIQETRKRKITEHFEIVIHPNKKGEIDLASLKSWRKS